MTSTQSDLFSDAALDPSISITPQKVDLTREPEAVLLTGASGFVGTFFLHHLLKKTQANIFCLIRARDDSEAKKKIKKNLEYFSLWNDDWDSRIFLVRGNLSQHFLGLPKESFEELANQIDIIYHIGASVNLIYSYQRLKATNVGGTHEVIRLAAHGKAKTLHYISTIAVLPVTGHPQGRAFSEEDPLIYSQGLLDGYAESKWVAEKLVREAISRGLSANIYRIGEVLGHSETGLFRGSHNDTYSNMLKGLILTGSAPDMSATLYLVPVDFVAESIYHLSRKGNSLGKTYHITGSPMDFSKIFDLTASLGYPLRRLPYNAWLQELAKVSKQSSGILMSALLLFFKSPAFRKIAQQKNLLKIDNRNTLDELAGSALTCPSSYKLLGTQLSHLRQIGFLPKQATEKGSRT